MPSSCPQTHWCFNALGDNELTVHMKRPFCWPVLVIITCFNMIFVSIVGFWTVVYHVYQLIIVPVIIRMMCQWCDRFRRVQFRLFSLVIFSATGHQHIIHVPILMVEWNVMVITLLYAIHFKDWERQKKLPPFCRKHIEMYHPEWKSYNFDLLLFKFHFSLTSIV